MFHALKMLLGVLLFAALAGALFGHVERQAEFSRVVGEQSIATRRRVDTPVPARTMSLTATVTAGARATLTSTVTATASETVTPDPR